MRPECAMPAISSGVMLTSPNVDRVVFGRNANSKHEQKSNQMK